MTDLNNIVRLYDRAGEPLTEDELIENEKYHQFEIKQAELKGALHGQNEYLINLVNDVMELTAEVYGQQGIVEGWRVRNTQAS